MSYMRMRWVSRDGRVAVERRYHSARAMALLPKNKERRARKEAETCLTQEKVNARLREERLVFLCLDNFVLGDHYLTLTYRSKAEGGGDVPEAAQVRADFERWKRRVRSIYRREGVPMKYVSVLERIGGGGRPHGHVLLPELSHAALKEVIAAWPHGRVKVETYQGELEDAKKLMAYFVKEGVDKETGSGRVMTSRNLVRREPERVRVSRSDTYRDELVPPPGYDVVKAYTREGFTSHGYAFSTGFFVRRESAGKIFAWGGLEHGRVRDGASGARDGRGVVADRGGGVVRRGDVLSRDGTARGSGVVRR